MKALRSAGRSASLQPHWPDRLATVTRSRRRGGRRSRVLRRALAAALLIAAGVLAVAGQRAAPVGRAVTAFSRDLPIGATLTASDVSTVHLTTPPDGVLTAAQAIGAVLAGPVRKGEVLTDARLVPPGGPRPGAGRVAVPIRPADPATAELLSAGMHVAVLSVDENGRATVLATDAVVLSIPPPPKSEPGKRLVVLAVPVAAADRVTAISLHGSLALRFT
jgi:pilus assembly protein CpaB